MAHYAIGLDLGSSEVRAVIVRMSLGGAEIERMVSEPVPLNENGFSDSAEVYTAAGRLIGRLGLEGESVYVAMPGEAASIQRTTLPSSVGKKLESVLRFELDEVLPFDLDDAVFDYVEVRRDKDDISLLSTTFQKDQVEALISGLSENGIQPREIGVAPFEYLKGLSYTDDPEETAAIIDMGHERTNLVILDKNTPTLRTLIRGGRELTLRLARVGDIDYEKAEEYKREHGMSERVGEVLAAGLKPLMRELQQTFKAHLASGGRPVTRIVLCGGGALLKGLDDHLAREMGVPVVTYTTRVRKAAHLTELASNPRFALAQGVALREESPTTARIDLRRGDLAFKGDYEYLKSRLKWLALCLGAIIVSWLFATGAEYEALSDRSEAQQALVVKKTKEILKKEISDHNEIRKLLAEENVEDPPLPKKDAFDILVELSKRIPVNVVHDVDFLEIKSKRITIKGIVDADLKEPDAGVAGMDGTKLQTSSEEDTEMVPDLSPTDLIKQKLEEFNECFAAIRVGNVTSVADRRRYTMEIDTRCP